MQSSSLEFGAKTRKMHHLYLTSAQLGLTNLDNINMPNCGISPEFTIYLGKFYTDRLDNLFQNVPTFKRSLKQDKS